MLEHLDKPNDVLNIIKKLGTKNCIFISVPNGTEIINKEKILAKKGPVQPLEHLNCFSKKFKKILYINGFRPLSFKRNYYYEHKRSSIQFNKYEIFLLDINNFFFQHQLDLN